MTKGGTVTKGDSTSAQVRSCLSIVADAVRSAGGRGLQDVVLTRIIAADPANDLAEIAAAHKAAFADAGAEWPANTTFGGPSLGLGSAWASRRQLSYRANQCKRRRRCRRRRRHIRASWASTYRPSTREPRSPAAVALTRHRQDEQVDCQYTLNTSPDSGKPA